MRGLQLLLLFLPLALLAHWAGLSGIMVFAASALAIIPLAKLLGEATEVLAEKTGPRIGGLLNATFGNAAELIIALIAISKGPAMYSLVKASITGSIIGFGVIRRLSAVRWGVTHNIVWAWLLTIPVSGCIGALTYWAVSAVANRSW